MTTSTTGSTEWSKPYNVLIGDTAAPDSVALAACVDTKSGSGLNGIRVYYASSYGMIREVGMDFDESIQHPVWNMWQVFNGTNNSGGVACALSDNISHVYLRSRRSKALQQYYWSYIDNDEWYLRMYTSSATTRRKLTSHRRNRPFRSSSSLRHRGDIR